MATTRDLQTILKDVNKRPETSGYRLRLDLSAIILKELKRKGWSQKKLAEAAGMKESFITRVIHADQNCTFDVAGRLLFALGLNAGLVESLENAPAPAGSTRQRKRG